MVRIRQKHLCIDVRVLHQRHINSDTEKRHSTAFANIQRQSPACIRRRRPTTLVSKSLMADGALHLWLGNVAAGPFPPRPTRDKHFRIRCLVHDHNATLSLPSHSSSFDQRLRPETFFTAIATAFFWPTRTTSFLPRVTPV